MSAEAPLPDPGRIAIEEFVMGDPDDPVVRGRRREGPPTTSGRLTLADRLWEMAGFGPDGDIPLLEASHYDEAVAVAGRVYGFGLRAREAMDELRRYVSDRPWEPEGVPADPF